MLQLSRELRVVYFLLTRLLSFRFRLILPCYSFLFLHLRLYLLLPQINFVFHIFFALLFISFFIPSLRLIPIVMSCTVVAMKGQR